MDIGIDRLNKAFDAMEADLNTFIARHQRIRKDRTALLQAAKAALPYLADHIAMTADQGPGDRIAHDKLEAAIEAAEEPL